MQTPDQTKPVNPPVPEGDETGPARNRSPKRWLRSGLKWGGIAAIALIWLWTCGGLHFIGKLPAPLALLLIPTLPLALWHWRRWRVLVAAVAICATFWIAVSVLSLQRPTDLNIKAWWEGNRRPPVLRFDKKPEWSPDTREVGIQNVRHFKWRTRDDFEPSWVFQTFYMDQLDSLDLIVEPLGDSKLFAHTMLSFGFGAERRVVVSIEARRELGERFSIWGGLYRQYELFYQINNERDAFTLRTIDPESNLYVFPVRATPEFIRTLFLDLMRGAAALDAEPEYYHSFKANCTTKLFEHINRALPEPLSYSREVLFPAQAGRRLHELGWMDTELDYPAAKERFRLADRVREFADHPDFSEKIRETDAVASDGE